MLVPPGTGVSWRVLGGDIITCKATARETGGTFSLFETITPPRCGPPPHVHHREDELFYIVDGTFEFYVEGKTIRAETGATVLAPRDIPHRFQNVGDTPGKLLILVQPGGVENFFAEFAQFDPDAHPDLDSVKAVALKYGMEILLP
jgi:quercetin dioxygenase-like cupin family protein